MFKLWYEWGISLVSLSDAFNTLDRQWMRRFEEVPLENDGVTLH